MNCDSLAPEFLLFSTTEMTRETPKLSPDGRSHPPPTPHWPQYFFTWSISLHLLNSSFRWYYNSSHFADEEIQAQKVSYLARVFQLNKWWSPNPNPNPRVESQSLSPALTLVTFLSKDLVSLKGPLGK